MSKKVLAIACADIHLSHTPPLARSKEPDWYAAMARPLCEISDLADKHGGVPVLCAGDVFDRWNPPPELINFALDHLPVMYAIPGQHDLPYHGLNQIKMSAFWTLVQAERINWVTDRANGHVVAPNRNQISETDAICIHGFGWGMKVEEPALCQNNYRHVCLHHAYRWHVGAGYIHADAKDYVGEEENPPNKLYPGYDVVITGDNHKSFEVKANGTILFNPGSLMRRHSDQIDHKPRVGLIMEDGSVQGHYLDISKDVFNPIPGTGGSDSNMNAELEGFLTRLQDLQSTTTDFREVVLRAVNDLKISQAAKTYLLEAIDFHA